MICSACGTFRKSAWGMYQHYKIEHCDGMSPQERCDTAYDAVGEMLSEDESTDSMDNEYTSDKARIRNGMKHSSCQ